MRICVIPARGGSKRIARKNARNFCGIPIVVRSISIALESNLFAEVVVSTDDEEIAELAESAGARAPFRRNAELSDDHTPTNPVVADAIKRLRTKSADPQHVCCLYPTAPFVRAADLARGLEALESAKADFSFAATTFDFPIQRALVVADNGLARPMFPTTIAMRSQDLPDAIHDAGQFYWGHPYSFARFDVVFNARCVPVMLPRARVQDVDTAEDWQRAEAMFRALEELDES